MSVTSAEPELLCCTQYFYLCPLDILIQRPQVGTYSDRPNGYSLLLLLQLLVHHCRGARVRSLLAVDAVADSKAV